MPKFRSDVCLRDVYTLAFPVSRLRALTFLNIFFKNLKHSTGRKIRTSRNAIEAAAVMQTLPETSIRRQDWQILHAIRPSEVLIVWL